MNEDQPTPPQRAPTKLPQAKKALLIIALLGFVSLFLIARNLDVISGFMDSSDEGQRRSGLYPALLFSFLVIVLAGGLLWCVKFWRVIDEAAQRAHLDAFYWGGSIAWMVIVPFVILPLKINGFTLPFVADLEMNQSQIFSLGVFTTIVVTTLGYGVAWTIWWLRRR